MGLENFWRPETDIDKIQKDGESDFYEEKDEKDQYTHEKIPRELINTIKLVEEDSHALNEIYIWYSKAISRRDREPLEEERFINHFDGGSFDPTYAYGSRETGYLLGFVKYGVFIPTHFAPKNLRGGYELVKNLGDSKDTPAVIALTEDLSSTIQKMPSWHKVDLSFMSMFREEEVEKEIVYNSHPDTKNLMLGLLNEYLEEQRTRSESV